jgi:hypothetical protein
MRRPWPTSASSAVKKSLLELKCNKISNVDILLTVTICLTTNLHSVFIRNMYVYCFSPYSTFILTTLLLKTLMG